MIFLKCHTTSGAKPTSLQKQNTKSMKQLFTFLMLIVGLSHFAQIKGTITDQTGMPLPVVSILVENT
jgi:hypothetical protein